MVVLHTAGRVFTWGFGGYGRLGHGHNKDCNVPTPVELFSRVPPPPNPKLPAFMQRRGRKIRAKKIMCGSTSTFCLARDMTGVYMWGITKKSGEATMAPAQLDDLAGRYLMDLYFETFVRHCVPHNGLD